MQKKTFRTQYFGVSEILALVVACFLLGVFLFFLWGILSFAFDERESLSLRDRACPPPDISSTTTSEDV